MLPWKLQKRQILTVYQNLLSVYFSLAKFLLVSCNLSLAMIWQMTYTFKLPKLCSATLKSAIGELIRNRVQQIAQPRPQDTFPWLWRWKSAPADEVADGPLVKH